MPPYPAIRWEMWGVELPEVPRTAGRRSAAGGFGPGGLYSYREPEHHAASIQSEHQDSGAVAGIGS